MRVKKNKIWFDFSDRKYSHLKEKLLGRRLDEEQIEMLQFPGGFEIGITLECFRFNKYGDIVMSDELKHKQCTRLIRYNNGLSWLKVTQILRGLSDKEKDKIRLIKDLQEI